MIPYLDFVAKLGVELTPGQRVLCAVAFDGIDPIDLDGDERALAADIFGPIDEVPDLARGVFVACCGARIGKSRFLVGLRGLHCALTVPVAQLAPGETASAIIVAPDTRLAKQALRYVVGAIDDTPAISRLVVGRTEDSITIQRERDVTIEVLPATRGGSAVRGRSLVFGAMDESAFFRDSSGYVVNDAEVARALLPRVMKGGQLVIASTPWSESGLLHELFVENHGAPKAALVAHAPTLLLRTDDLTREIVEREEQRDADNAAREFGAQFMIAGSGQFFDGALVDACFEDL